jgi:hypothetical protein
MTERKLQAIRALAERPGTPAEGEVARAMLARHQSAREAAEANFTEWDWFERWLREDDWDALARACGIDPERFFEP